LSAPYVSQIRAYGFGFAPKTWAQCNGQLLPIAQNQALFSLIGTYYGGNGVQTFALPDLRSRVPVHFNVSAGYNLGTQAGAETVPLNATQMPQHNHSFSGTTTAGTLGRPNNSYLSNITNNYNHYANATTLAPLNPASVVSAGGQPHPNLQPYLAINYCIALQGIFPSRN
jgi:microcystin-dependent protein